MRAWSPAVQLYRRGRPHPARMVRGRGRAARQHDRRHRGAGRPPRRHPQLGLYRQRSDWLPSRPNGPSAPARSRRGFSDALHERLTQRFVDRRTAVLVRDMGARGADALPVTVAADGEVSVGPEPIGHLDRLRLQGRSVRASRRQAPAAGSRRAAPGRRARPPGAGLLEAPRPSLRADRRGRRTVAVGWHGHVLARLAAGPLAARAGIAHRPGARPAVGAEPGRACARASKPGSTRRSTAPRAAQAARRGGDRPSSRPGCARWPRCLPTPAECFRARRRSAHRPSRAGRPQRASPLVSGSARSTSSSPLLKPAPNFGARALLAVRSGCRCPPFRRPARRCSRPRPTRAARRGFPPPRPRGIRVDLADRLASHARQVRSAGGAAGRRRAGDIDRARRRRVARLMRRSASPAQAMPGAGAAAAAPRARSARVPSHAFAELAKLKLECGSTAFSLHPPGEEPRLAQRSIDDGHVRVDGKRVASQRGGACRASLRCRCAAQVRVHPGRLPARSARAGGRSACLLRGAGN